MEVPGFPGPSGWRAGFTTRRAGGEMRGVLELLGWSDHPVFRLEQRHETEIVPVLPGETAERRRIGDGLTSERRGVVLAVASADCVPIVLFDPLCPAATVLHAGWRGTRSHIAHSGVDTMRRLYGSSAASLRAMIGPAIGSCCYRVGREVIEQFREAGHRVDRLLRPDGEGGFLNLSEANRSDLAEAGVNPENIRSAELCTRCLAGLFPSYRRDGERTGRILTFVASSPEA
ncbi:MAG TPA: peptidoglycan editing factor PgeF [Candidatus Polarisedimenticolia bacterium]|nr:peptidoglycan editing factor PgeF [Candidatus Polarisedimenticolia bacterium]